MNKTFETKNAIYYKDRIFLKKRKKVILKDDIKEIYYIRRSVKNYFLFAQSMAIGYVYILLKKPSFFRKWYGFKMDYDEVLKIKSIIDVKIRIYE